MTARTAPTVPTTAAPGRTAGLARPPWAGMRLLRLHAAGRRVPAATAAIAACAIGLRIALIGHWNTYGALQLPLVFEAGSAVAITVTTASPIGEPRTPHRPVAAVLAAGRRARADRPPQQAR